MYSKIKLFNLKSKNMKTLILALIIFSGFSNDDAQNLKSVSDCKCAANGRYYDVYGTTCLGGFWSQCLPNENNSNYCGWVYSTDANGDYLRCDE